VRGRPGYVAGVWAPLETAVGWITAAGGQAVLAHPARYKMTGTRLNRFLGEFKACGGVGMEVVCGSHSVDETRVMAQRAKNLGLLGSTGSDFHDPASPWVELGRLAPLPVDVVPVWKDW
jgi:predicted metal-dependent phosphoesterase TrpH